MSSADAILEVFAPLRPSQRLGHASTGDAVGLAFHVGGGFLLTAAHVVNAALLRDERDTVRPPENTRVTVRTGALDAVSGEQMHQFKADVVGWLPSTAAASAFDASDVAVLRVGDDDRNYITGVVRLAETVPDHGKTQMYGPPAKKVRDERDGRVERAKNSARFGPVVGHVRGGAEGRRLLVLQEPGGGFEVDEGYSGGPVLLADHAIGMVVSVGDEHAVYAIRPDTLETALRAARPVRSPFMPLRPFGEDDAQFFLGRDEAVAKLTREAVRLPAMMVVGGSGTGKTSLVEAGLIPSLRRHYAASGKKIEVVRLRPGDDPLVALESEFESFGGRAGLGLPFSRRGWIDLLRSKGIQETARRLLQEKRLARLVVIVDQAEELVGMCAAADREAFASVLAKAIGDGGPKGGLPLLMVATLRREYVEDFLKIHESLRSYFDGSGTRYEVEPLDEESLRRVVRGAADAVGLDFEYALVKQIAKDLVDNPHALPLLHLLLAELGRRRNGDATFGIDDYVAADGDEGAVSSFCDRILERMAVEDGERARRILTRLGVPGKAGSRQFMYTNELNADDSAFVGRMEDEGLVTVNPGPTAGSCGSRVDIAGEVLLDEWGTLREWMEEDRDKLDAIQRAVSGMRRWQRSGSGSAHLLRGADLYKAEWLLEDHPRESVFLRPYVEASQEALPTVARPGYRAAVDALHLAFQAQETGQVRARAPVAVALALMSMDLRVTVPGDRALRSAIARAAKPDRQIEHGSPILAVAFHQDSQRVALAGKNGRVQIADLAHDGRTVYLPPHDKPVRWVTFSGDGSQVATACDDGSLRIFRLASRRPPECVFGSPPESAVLAADLSSAGSRIASGSVSGVVRLYDVRTGREIGRQHHYDSVHAVAFSPDGDLVATAGKDGVVLVLDASNAFPRDVLRLGSAVFSVVFSADATRLAAGAADGLVRVYDLSATSDRLLWVARHLGPVRSVRFSPDGTRVASGSDDGTLRLWDGSTGAETLRHDHGKAVRKVVFSADGDFLGTAGADGTARLIDAHDERRSAVILHDGSEVLDVAFSPKPKSRRLATAGADGVSWVVDVGASMPAQPVVRHEFGPVNGLAFASDGEHMASVGADGRLWLIDPTGSDEPICRMSAPDALIDVACHPNRMEALVAGADGTVRLVDLDGVKEPLLVTRVVSARAVLFSDDGSSYVVLDDKEGLLEFFDRRGRNKGEPWRVDVDVTSFSAVYKSSAGVLVGAAATKNNGITFFNGSGALELDLMGVEGASSVSMSRDGRRICVVSLDGAVRVFDVSDLAEPIFAPKSGKIYGVAVLDDNGRRLACADRHGRAKVTDLDADEDAAEVSHPSRVTVLRFDSAGRWLVTGCEDGSVNVWPLDSELKQMAQCRITCEPNPEESSRYEPFHPWRTFTADASWRGGRRTS